MYQQEPGRDVLKDIYKGMCKKTASAALRVSGKGYFQCK